MALFVQRMHCEQGWLMQSLVDRSLHYTNTPYRPTSHIRVIVVYFIVLIACACSDAIARLYGVQTV